MCVKEIRKIKEENTRLKELLNVIYNRLRAIQVAIDDNKQIHIEPEKTVTDEYESYYVRDEEFIKDYYDSGGVWSYQTPEEILEEVIRMIKTEDVEEWPIY